MIKKKAIAIVQSNYIPWKGYFDLIAAVDEFILYDDVQYTRRDWRNRNQIKTPHGVQWLTVPVKVKGKYSQSIRDTQIDGTDWAQTHWKALTQNYARAPHFREIAAWLEPTYLGESYSHLWQLNHRLIRDVCEYLRIGTALSRSFDFRLIDGQTERLVDLCRQTGATRYVSGPAAKDYLKEPLFLENGIELTWFDYSGYPEYPQLWGAFTHQVSILDLLFNCGREAPRFMRYVRK